MELSIIIVSYNTKELLLACIKSIIETVKKVSYEIVVVDNASVDGTAREISNLIRQPADQISNKNSNFKFIQNKENLGFSKANNIGVKQAKGRYLLFINPDTLVYERTIDGMVEFMESHQDAGAATCFVEMPNGKMDDAAHRGFPTPWRAFCHFTGLSKLFPKSKFFSGYSLGWMDLTRMHEIDACAGAFMMVRREAGEQVGWWDEDYFWYGEDLDLCYRLKEKGWKIYFVPELRILHYKGVSGGIKKHSQQLSTADRETRRRATQARFEVMKIFYDKHYKHKYPAIVNWLVSLGINFKLLVASKKFLIIDIMTNLS